jgi:4-hydroxybenzoate polyprenyltransferase
LIAASLARVGAGPVAWTGFLAFAAHLAWQVRRIDRSDGVGALRLFRSNREAGLILAVALAAEAWMRGAGILA